MLLRLADLGLGVARWESYSRCRLVNFGCRSQSYEGGMPAGIHSSLKAASARACCPRVGWAACKGRRHVRIRVTHDGRAPARPVEHVRGGRNAAPVPWLKMRVASSAGCKAQLRVCRSIELCAACKIGRKYTMHGRCVISFRARREYNMLYSRSSFMPCSSWIVLNQA